MCGPNRKGRDDLTSSPPSSVLATAVCIEFLSYDNGNYREEQDCEVKPILKSCLSSDCSLQLENMKLESLVIAEQHAAVNTFPGLVHTARHAMGVGSA